MSVYFSLKRCYNIYIRLHKERESNMENKKRIFKMFCIKGVDKYGVVNEDLIGLFFSIDGEIVDECEEDNIGDIINDSYEMLNMNCDNYNFDGRRDKLEIRINYDFG
jgi:hypothetical protein